MKTAFLFHELFLRHDTGAMHPENAERLRAILRGLKEGGIWPRLLQVEPTPASEDQILLAHTKKLFNLIHESSRRGSVWLDSDTHVCADSFDAAMMAAGAAIRGVQGIMEGEFEAAFACVRPPGHHATANRAMGFCLFNNIAVAARFLVRNYGLKHVLIVDWDVHHGNGTQDIFYNDPSVLYISLHKKYHYPGTGWEEESGSGDARGTKINVPMGAPHDPNFYVMHFREALHEAEKFAPEFILVSCGFDAHRNDPLGNLGLHSETYGQLTQILLDSAASFGHRRFFSILEGGYDLGALAESSVSHLETLLSA